MSTIPSVYFTSPHVEQPLTYYNVPALNQLIDTSGADILNMLFQARDKNMHPPLYYVVAFWGNSELVHRLIRLGAHVDQPHLCLGGTALHAFLYRQNEHLADLNLFQYLLENTQDIDAVDTEGFTPLHRALFYGSAGSSEPNWDLIRLLLLKGANPNAVTKDGKTALDLLIERAGNIPLRLLKHRAEQLIEHFEKYALFVPQALPLEEIRNDLNVQITSFKNLPIDLTRPGSLPNPRLALETCRKAYKENGVHLVRIRKSLMYRLEKRLTSYYYKWRWSPHPSFSVVLNPENLPYLHKLYEGHDDFLALLSAEKENCTPTNDQTSNPNSDL